MTKSFKGEYMLRLMVCFISAFLLITGCSNKNELDHENYIDEIFSYQINTIEPKHAEEVTKWLESSKKDAKQRHYFVYSISDDKSEYSYNYIYGKGFTDYEASLIYTKSRNNNKGELYIVGTSWSETGDSFIKIKYLKQYVDVMSLSENSIGEKLK